MADEVTLAPAAADAPAATPSAPATPADATAPVTGNSPPTQADAPEPAAAPAAAEPVKTPGLLAPDPAKPAETPKTDGAAPQPEAPAQGAQSEEPAPLPTYEAFVLPEGITAGEEQLGDFSKMLGEFERATKADHAEMQKFGQSLLDTHIGELQSAIAKVHQGYQANWENLKTEWIKKFDADPEIGGNRRDTSLREAKEFINTHGGKPEHVAAFYKALQDTGADCHPDVVRFLVNAKNSPAFRTPEPVPAQAPALKESKSSKWYGGGKK